MQWSHFILQSLFYASTTYKSYLIELEYRSCATGYCFLGSIPSKCAWEHLNGPIHVNGDIFNFPYPFFFVTQKP